jgi:putative ABC transport system permease protein
MIWNYLIVALRNIRKNKGYSFINIAGLAIGMAVCVLILLYVQDELSFDGYHKHAGRVYRIERAARLEDGSIQAYFCTLAPSFVPFLEKDFPEIEHAVRLYQPANVLLRIGERGFSEERLFFAEEDIFEVFTIPLLKGNPETALKNPGSIVLSRSMARKYFGDQEPMDQEMLLDNRSLLQVTGVMEDSPPNTHIHIDFLVSYISLKGLYGQGENDYFHGTRNFSDNVTLVYVRLAENASAEAIQAKIPEFLDRNIPTRQDQDGSIIKASERAFLHIRKAKDIHLHSHTTKEVEPNSDIRYVVLFTLVGVFILVIACINFMNLSTARASKRAREVGLRKVVGANRRRLAIQFLGESMIVCLVALVLTLAVVMLVLPVFRVFSGHEVYMRHLFSPAGLLILVGIFFMSGLAAGIYPALYISAFQPVTILRGELTRGLKAQFLRKALVVFQFATTIALIFAVTVVHKQMLFMRNADLGYERENILLIPADREVITRWQELKQELLKNPKVLAAGLSKRAPTGRLVDSPGFAIELNGQRIISPFGMPHNRVSHEFFKTYGMSIIAGRDFSEEYSTDASEAFIINETALRQLGLKSPEDAVGLPFETFAPDKKGKVIGVVRDFNYESLRDEIKPIVTYIAPNQANTLSVRLAKGDIRETIGHIKDVWNDFFPGYPLQYDFLDDRINELYRNEERMLAMFGYFSLLAIIIGCLGLLGLAAFSAEQRTKEIGVRKVLGATAPNIALLLSQEFAKLVILANVIAWPLAYLAMNSWLRNFAYAARIGALPFVFSALSALLAALLAVSYQSVKSAVANPVDALRYE